MKKFEEKWTAWLDDQLSGQELADFEASLPDRAAAEAEKRSARELGQLLRRELMPQPIQNPDFFNHQIRSQIEADDMVADYAGGEERSPWWTLPKLLWSGAVAAALVTITTIYVMREDQRPTQSQYVSQIMNARVEPSLNPNASVSIFQVGEDKVTVLWVDGLESLPSEYAAK